MHCYPDHEAVSALLRVSSSRVDDTLGGGMGDFSSRRPTIHMAEDAVSQAHEQNYALCLMF